MTHMLKRLSMLLQLCIGIAGCNSGSEAQPGGEHSLENAVRYNSPNDFFKLDMGSEQVNPATGALYCPERDDNEQIQLTAHGNQVRVTCGLTFISPHYAITADHCVDIGSCGGSGESFKVRQFDISNLNLDRFKEASTLQNVSDTDFENWQFTDYLTSDDGYEATDYDCEVTALCSNTSTVGNRKEDEICKLDGKRFVKDIALIYCPNRDNSAPYVDVAESIVVGDSVRSHWFFEMTDLPLPQSCDTKECANANAFYNMSASNKHNFHYIGYDGVRETQLFPLVSIPFAPTNENAVAFQKNVAASKERSYSYSDGSTDQSNPDSFGMDTMAMLEDSDSMPEGQDSYIDTDTCSWISGDAETNSSTPIIPAEHVVLNVCNGLAGTDIWGCHGISGSGIFQIGNDGKERLLGPVVAFGNDTGAEKYLCETANAQPGNDYLKFGIPKYSSALANWALKNDTNL